MTNGVQYLTETQKDLLIEALMALIGDETRAKLIEQIPHTYAAYQGKRPW